MFLLGCQAYISQLRELQKTLPPRFGGNEVDCVLQPILDFCPKMNTLPWTLLVRMLMVVGSQHAEKPSVVDESIDRETFRFPESVKVRLAEFLRCQLQKWDARGMSELQVTRCTYEIEASEHLSQAK